MSAWYLGAIVNESDFRETHEETSTYSSLFCNKRNLDTGSAKAPLSALNLPTLEFSRFYAVHPI